MKILEWREKEAERAWAGRSQGGAAAGGSQRFEADGDLPAAGSRELCGGSWVGEEGRSPGGWMLPEGQPFRRAPCWAAGQTGLVQTGRAGCEGLPKLPEGPAAATQTPLRSKAKGQLTCTSPWRPQSQGTLSPNETPASEQGRCGVKDSWGMRSAQGTLRGVASHSPSQMPLATAGAETGSRLIGEPSPPRAPQTPTKPQPPWAFPGQCLNSTDMRVTAPRASSDRRLDTAHPGGRCCPVPVLAS